MDGTAIGLPIVWAQNAVASTTTAPSALAPLALRRWFGSLTLSSHESVPSLFGLWVILAALGGLTLIAMIVQGPGRALSQLFDLGGHVRLLSASFRRLRRAGRLLAVTIGLTVLSWTGSQALVYNNAEGRNDYLQLTRARHLGELAVEQGILAALTPLRDIVGLGSNLPLVFLATILVFRATTDSWAGASAHPWGAGNTISGSGWAHAAWFSGAFLILYRLASIGSGLFDLPLGGCLLIEPLVVPALMAIVDGLVLAWALTEMRDAGLEQPDGIRFSPRPTVELLPASIAACLVAMPARYLASGVLLALYHLPTSTDATGLGRYMRWQLGPGLVISQGFGLIFAGLVGVVAWGVGSINEAARAFGRLLAVEGARLAAVLGTAGLASALASSIAYFVVLSLPAAPWVLNAADSYAHYCTLPIGLLTLSALVELGERALPEATRARA